MRRNSTIIFFALTFIVGLLSCEKKGKAEIFGTVAHHEAIIPHAMVYIKLGTNVFPGEDLSQYDFSVEASHHATYSFTELQTGLAYVYAVGWDEAISDSVFGGIPFEISEKKQVLEVNIPVTE